MARLLTFPERVSHHNIEKLRQCIRNGPEKHPGAIMIKYPDGSARQDSVLFYVSFFGVCSDNGVFVFSLFVLVQSLEWYV